MTSREEKKQAFIIIITIFLLSINLRPAITSIGPMLDIIREDLVLTNTQVTLLTALPVICMGVFASLAPVLNRKFGLKTVIYVMLTIIGLATASRGLIGGYAVLIISALLVGIAIAVIGPLISAMIKQHFPDRAASVIGVYSLGMGVGSAASAGLTVVFFEMTGSYLFALSIWSVLVLVVLISWFFAMKSQIEVRQQAPEIVKAKRGQALSPWKSKKSWLYLLFFGLQSSAFFSIITWLAPIATSAGMTLLQAGSLLSLMTVIQIVLNITLPLLMERFPARKFWLFFMTIAGMLAVVLFWTGIHPLMWVGAFLMGIPLGGLFPVALLLPLDETETAEEASTWTAMMQTGGFIIGGLLPLLIALVFDWTANHNFTFIIFMALYMMMFLLSFIIGDKKTSTI